MSVSRGIDISKFYPEAYVGNLTKTSNILDDDRFTGDVKVIEDFLNQGDYVAAAQGVLLKLENPGNFNADVIMACANLAVSVYRVLHQEGDNDHAQQAKELLVLGMANTNHRLPGQVFPNSVLRYIKILHNFRSEDGLALAEDIVRLLPEDDPTRKLVEPWLAALTVEEEGRGQQEPWVVEVLDSLGNSHSVTAYDGEQDFAAILPDQSFPKRMSMGYNPVIVRSRELLFELMGEQYMKELKLTHDRLPEVFLLFQASAEDDWVQLLFHVDGQGYCYARLQPNSHAGKCYSAFRNANQ